MQLDLVIVTFNRLDKLKKSLQCYDEQTQRFRNLILIDNCSTDGTREFLDEWAKLESCFHKIVIHSDENMGGSGGFYLGQKKAMELGADWIFIADDDAYAAPNMVEEFYDYLSKNCTNKISAVCAKVLRTDGTIATDHRDRFLITDGKKWPYKRFNRLHVLETEYTKEVFSIDLLSYVGSFLNSKALLKYGLVNPNYFIFYDDTEHSLRLRKYGSILVVPKITIVHEGGVTEEKKGYVSWRSYYSTRNCTHMLLKHFPRTAIFDVYMGFRRIIGRKLHHHSSNALDIQQERAIWDAFWGKLGKHKKYKPGWESQK